jgi:hypothetical protein
MNIRAGNGDPWGVKESSFPYGGSPAERLRFCLNYAILAPSIHNTQPWLFRQFDDWVEVYADRSRALPVTDPDGRQLVISCGAAMLNLIAAVRHFRYETTIQYLPEPGDPDLLARVRVGRARFPDYQDESLFRAIRRRRTTRLPFQPRRVPRALQRRLIWLASEHNCWLHFVESPHDRERVAELVAQGDRLQLANPAFRAELAEWIRPIGDEHRDGISADAFGLSQLLDYSTPLTASAVRTFDLGRGRAARNRELLDASPVLVVLGTGNDGTFEWLHAGQAMEQMLLRASSEDVTASFLNQACEIPELREELRKITGRSGPPQLLLRLGYGPKGALTPRRPVSEVLLERDPLSVSMTE